MSRDGWTFVIFGIAILAILVSVFAIGLALRDDDEGGGESRSRRGELSADLSEFSIALSAPSLDVGGSIEVTNSGSQVHNLGVTDTDLVTPDIQPGGSATLDLSGLDGRTRSIARSRDTQSRG